MRNVFRALLALVAIAAAATSVATARADGDKKRASPHEKVTGTVAGRTITIEYGRPFKKGRKIFGAGKEALVPDGEVWRTGADEATTFTTDGDIRLGSLKVPKGTYALFTIPSPGGWTLILNKVAKQWGAYSYDSKQDLGRTPMAIMQAANPVEQLTISIEPVDKGGTLQIAWDKTVATAPITP